MKHANSAQRTLIMQLTVTVRRCPTSAPSSLPQKCQNTSSYMPRPSHIPHPQFQLQSWQFQRTCETEASVFCQRRASQLEQSRVARATLQR